MQINDISQPSRSVPSFRAGGRPRAALAVTVTVTAALVAAAAVPFSASASASSAGAPTSAATSGSTSGGARPHRPSPLRPAGQAVVDAGASGFAARVGDGRRTETVAVGVADRASGRPLSATDQFQIGSVTKTFVATLALQLVAEHRLGLDDTVDHLLPGVVPNGGRTTLRMLLNHTSGLHEYADDTFLAAVRADPDRRWTPQQLIAPALAHPADFAPGKGWAYSNTNYVLVGMILRRVTGRDVADLIADRIARPLHLAHTYLDTGAGPRGRQAHGYLLQPGAAGSRPTYTDVTGYSLTTADAAGAMISTSEDLADFFRALLGGRLLPAAQLRQMRTVARGGPGGPAGGYGLGLVRADTPCGTVWGHTGGTFGYTTFAWFSPDGRRSSVETIPTVALSDTPTALDGAAQLAQLQGVCQMYGRPLPARPPAAARPAAAA